MQRQPYLANFERSQRKNFTPFNFLTPYNFRNCLHSILIGLFKIFGPVKPMQLGPPLQWPMKDGKYIMASLAGRWKHRTDQWIDLIDPSQKNLSFCSTCSHQLNYMGSNNIIKPLMSSFPQTSTADDISWQHHNVQLKSFGYVGNAFGPFGLNIRKELDFCWRQMFS